MNTTHDQYPTPHELELNIARGFKTLPQSKTYEHFNCKDCGTQVVWAVSKKTGKTYLAGLKGWSSDYSSSSNGKYNERFYYPFHKCEANPEYQARYAEAMAFLNADREAKVAAGEIVVGQTVEVFKGKKIPVGTTGVVFWVAPEPDNYDTIKVGLKTATDEKVYVNISHLKAVK